MKAEPPGATPAPAAVGRLRSPGASIVIALVLTAVGAMCFVVIAENVVDRHTQRFDEAVLQGLRRVDNPAVPIGPSWIAKAARDISALGSLSVLSLVTAGAAGLLAVARKHAAMWFLIVAVTGGVLLSGVLKQSFDRPRPSLVPHLDTVASPSFPSGHSMLAAIVYLTTAVLAARAAASRQTRIYMLLTGVAITALVGTSRVVLGVHYPTDVLAGWVGGAVWALSCWLVARRLNGPPWRAS